MENYEAELTNVVVIDIASQAVIRVKYSKTLSNKDFLFKLFS